MQVLKYVDGQKYGSHYDFSESQANLTGGQRYCTVLMYLSDVEHGGETVFPNSEVSDPPSRGSCSGSQYPTHQSLLHSVSLTHSLALHSRAFVCSVTVDTGVSTALA